jgi:hypothetical protein
MKASETHPAPVDAPPTGVDDRTGLPWFRTWRDVYAFVLVTFILWVALLLALTLSYS